MPRAAGPRRSGDPPSGSPGAFFFEGIESPNGTIFPDALLDLVMPFLSPTEWKVCSYIVRRTFGWKKASDRISLDQICHGIVRRDGSRLDHGTQLDRKTAIKALRGLETKGVIVAQRNYSDARGYEATTYGLRFRGQPPSRTLVEKLPQAPDDHRENLHQGAGEAVHQPPGEDLPQPGGAHPPALVASGHSQPTTGTTMHVTDCQSSKDNHGDAQPAAPASPGVAAAAQTDGLEAAPASLPLPGMERTTSDADAAIWTTVLARLEQQMTAANYQTWLADTHPLGRRGATLVVGAPSGFVRDWLQTRFRALVRRALQEAAPALSDVTFATNPPPPPNPAERS